MTQVTQVTSKTFTLTNALSSTGSETSITFTISETPNFTDGIVKINTGTDSEWVSFTGVTDNGDGTYTFTGCQRGLEKDASSRSDVASGNKKTHGADTTAELVHHSVDRNEFWQNDADTTLTGDNTITGTQTFQSTSTSTFQAQQVTTAQRDALTGVVDGAHLYDSTLDELQGRKNGAWSAYDEGATYQNASESIKGIVELSAPADNNAQTVQGESNAPVVLRTTDLAKDINDTPFAYKVPILNSSGVIERIFLADTTRKFGGTGEDGDLQASGNIADNNYSVKNYLTVQPGSLTLTGTGQNMVFHMKVAGDADFTNWTLNFSGVGGAGGVGGDLNTTSAPANGDAGNAGTQGNSTYLYSAAANGGAGGTSGGNGTDGAAPNAITANLNSLITGRHIFALAGGGGAGGGAGYNHTTASGSDVTEAGGNGGAGGGALIIEVAGDITFSSTTINVSGANGEDGLDGAGSGSSGYAASGGGGGGAGGTVIILCSGTITGSPTINVSGGTGGALGAAGASNYGGGGSGGASLNTNGNAGSGGAGGDGADGESITLTNHAFA